MGRHVQLVGIGLGSDTHHPSPHPGLTRHRVSCRASRCSEGGLSGAFAADTYPHTLTHRHPTRRHPSTHTDTPLPTDTPSQARRHPITHRHPSMHTDTPSHTPHYIHRHPSTHTHPITDTDTPSQTQIPHHTHRHPTTHTDTPSHTQTPHHTHHTDSHSHPPIASTHTHCPVPPRA